MKKKINVLLLILMILMMSGCANESRSPFLDKNEEEKGIDLYGTYDQNHLQIIALEKEYTGTICKIPQIEGLKDSDIEEKVNQDICERVVSTYEEFSQLNYVNYYTMANFSNVISIGVYIGADDAYEQIYLNYNLVSGERLTFDELFLADADTLDIIRNAFCEMLIKDQMMTDFDSSVVSFDENELYKIVKRYSESEDKEFAFSPSEIYFYYKGHSASVKMIDIADEVSVYSKYLTEESIYARNDLARENIFTCVDIPEDVFDVLEFGYGTDNLWYDVSVLEEYLSDEMDETKREQYSSFKEEIYRETFMELEEYQELAKQNPDRFYIFLAKPLITVEMESGCYTEQAVVNKNMQLFEMSKELFDNVYKDKLIAAYRYKYFAMQGGIYLDATEDVHWKEITETTRFNYVTGQIIEE